jgi:polyisoprenoid-binding protein YceI
MNTMRRLHPLLLSLALSGVTTAVTAVETTMTPPAVLPHGGKDITQVPSGTYTLDPNHVGVIARVSHLGFSYSVFRFGRVQSRLEWDSTNPARSRLAASVQTDSIETNVEGFAKQLAGEQYLKSAKFPLADFTSTAFRQTDATHGQVDGQFTLMGKTRPVTFDVSLVGAGKGFAGGPVMGHVIGIHAETSINPQDFGLPAIFSEPIALAIDTEFDHLP